MSPVASTVHIPRRFLSARVRPAVPLDTTSFTAPCPHGVPVEWTAWCEDTRSHFTVPCSCPEVAR